MHRSAPRLSRILACAALPLMLAVAGCSSDSGGGDDDKKKEKAGSSASASAEGGGGSEGSGADPGKPAEDTVAPATYAKLPSPCSAIGSSSVRDLVPGASPKGGTAGKSSDAQARANCHWKGSDDKGLKGTQYRWLDVSLLRYDSEEALKASGEQRARENYGKEVTKAKAVEGAKNVKSAAATGIGDEATSVTYTLRKVDADFAYTTIVSRIDNVVVTLTYNGAGMAGAASPSVEEVTKDAVKAAKEAVASIGEANEKGAATKPSGGGSPDASKKPATAGS